MRIKLSEIYVIMLKNGNEPSVVHHVGKAV